MEDNSIRSSISVPTDLTLTLTPSSSSSSTTTTTTTTSHHPPKLVPLISNSNKLIKKAKTWEDKYDLLLQQVNTLQINQVAQVSKLQADLKVKDYELIRMDKDLKDVKEQLNKGLKEKNEAQVEVKMLKDQLSATRRISEQENVHLRMELNEKSLKCEMYEKIQKKIDRVMFPDVPVQDGAGDEGDVDLDRVLATYGYGTISLDAKTKMQQSLDLAKRLASERDHLEKSRDEMQIRLHDVERRYHDVLLELNQLKLSDKRDISQLQSELKLKGFELERLSALYLETDGKSREALIEKERLLERLEGLREELCNLKSSSEHIITSLSLQLQDKTARLETYDKLEAELDKVVMQAAEESNEQTVDEVLSNYGQGLEVGVGANIIPTSSKRRLEHSLKLGRRVLELEKLIIDQKKELFSLRDKNASLQFEIDNLQASLLMCGYPTSNLLELNVKKELVIGKLKQTISNLESKVKAMSESNSYLEQRITQLEQELKKPKPYIRKPSKSQSPHVFNRYNSTSLGLSSIRVIPSSLKFKQVTFVDQGSQSETQSRIPKKMPLSFSKVSQKEVNSVV